MKAMVQDTYGAAAVLEARDIETPQIGDDQVLVRVRAAGVNIADWAVMSGLPYIARPVYGLRRPKHAIRGTDVSGIVAAVGTGVTRFRPGDEVFGWCDGSFAEYAVANEDGLAPMPANLTFEAAAAVPMAGLVALLALRDHAKVQPGQTVLVNGAAGGIGTFAVQIAKSMGAEVTGVCSTRNVELVRSIGADRVIDYTCDDFTKGDRQYDVILDNVANHSLTELRRVLAAEGTLIPNGGGFQHRWMASGGRLVRAAVLFKLGNQRLGNFLLAERLEDLLVLKGLIEAGSVTPVMDRAFDLSAARAAIDHVATGHARGKVALTVSRAASDALGSAATSTAVPAALRAVA
jgi:NADPH:quinone reductase-like Zn-dependent oxidoreductase